MTDGGVSSVQFLLASGLALLLFVMLANLVVVQYGRGSVQSALEQGARAGAVSGSPDECEAMAHDVLGQLLGGAMSKGLTVTCGVSGNLMIARGSGWFEAWTPLTPAYSISMAGEAAIEPIP